jgi:hypothetical protein
MHVAHGGGFGMWLILVDLLGREFGEGVKKSSIDGVSPGGNDRGEHSGVIESNTITKMRNVDGIG